MMDNSVSLISVGYAYLEKCTGKDVGKNIFAPVLSLNMQLESKIYFDVEVYDR